MHDRIPRTPSYKSCLEFENLARLGTYPRLHFEGRIYSNVEELHYTGKLAFALRERGIVPGDRVMVQPALPKNAVGKILKRAIREQLATTGLAA